MRAPSRLAAVLVLALCSTTSGCCSLARLFCGPDRTPWISVDFGAPEATVRTLLEALRRDDPETVYFCLSNDFRARLGVDAMTAQLAWPRIREQNPGLHLAGYADVPEPTRRGLDRAAFLLDVEGTAVEVALVRESYYLVRYARVLRGADGSVAFGPPGEVGASIPSFEGFAEVEVVDDRVDDRSRVTLAPLTFGHPGFDAIPLDQVERVGLERRWKIDAIRSR